MAKDRGDAVQLTVNGAWASGTGSKVAYIVPDNSNPTELYIAKPKRILVANRSGVANEVYFGDNDADAETVGTIPALTIPISANEGIILEESDLQGWEVVAGIVCSANAVTGTNGITVHVLEVDVKRAL